MLILAPGANSMIGGDVLVAPLIFGTPNPNGRAPNILRKRVLSASHHQRRHDHDHHDHHHRGYRGDTLHVVVKYSLNACRPISRQALRRRRRRRFLFILFCART